MDSGSNRVKLCLLASGSGGNSMYLESRSTAVLIDQGLSHKMLLERMALRGLDSEKISALFISHEHDDHISGAGITARKLGIPVYGTPGTLNSQKSQQRIFNGSEKLVLIESGVILKLGALEIQPYSISHDAVDPVQYVISSGRKKVVIATDLGFASTLVCQRLQGCDLLVLESNYDNEMLKKGTYPWPLKQRIMSKKGHLSNRNASELIFNITKNGKPKIVLAHLSEENNLPERAEQTVRELFEKFDKKLGHLVIASQREPTPVINV